VNRSTGLATGLVRLLLRLYPEEFRARYGEEMERTFEEQWQEKRAARPVRAAVFLGKTLTNVIAAALRERLEAARGGAGGTHDEGGHERRRRRGMVTHMGEDIRYGLRSLRRNPAFTTVVLLTLALGIGMNTAVFSVLYGVMFAPFPWRDAERLVQVGRTHPSIPNLFVLPLSNGGYYAMRESARSLSRLEAETGQQFVLADRGDAGRHRGSLVTAGFFDLLGVPAARGRTFTEADGVSGANAVVVLSDAFWRVQLGGDAGIIGQTIRLNDTPFTVIGIMPPSFSFNQSTLWTLLQLTDDQRSRWNSNYLRMYARLAPGVDVATATSELQAAWLPLREENPAGNQDTGFAARTLRELTVSSNRNSLYILAGAAAFVLLIACANVANLMLVRAERRQREVGVRAALGAGRRRLAAQFLTEGVLTAVAGGLLGVVVAWAGLRGLIAVFGSAIPRQTVVGLNLPVLGFSLLASLATGLLVGIAPALKSRIDFRILREGGRGGTARFSRLGRTLVVAEVALALMLVTGAGLLLKSYSRAMVSDLGFDASQLITANYWFPASRYPDNASQQVVLEQIVAALEVRPEIMSVAMSSMVPIRETGNNYTEVGAVGGEAKASFVESRWVTPSYFETMHTPVVRGRLFTMDEARSQNLPVVINETLARQLFADGDPLAWQLAIDGQPQIIGVVRDIRDSSPDQPPRPMMYRPTPVNSNLLVRTTRPAGEIAQLLRGAARNVDPNIVLIRIQTMDEILDASLAGRRFQLTLIGVFALTALVLSCVGIYGVLSYTVERQTREIGVRMALGARAARVASQIAWRGGQLAVIGVAIGMGGAFALKRAIAAQLFAVESFDPLVYAAVSAVVLLVAAVACLVPARRAAVIDPVQALAAE